MAMRYKLKIFRDLYGMFERGLRTKNWTIKEGNYGRRKVKETRIQALPQIPQHGEGHQEIPLLFQKRVLHLAQKRGEGTR